jgi:TRAP-type transport system periplasmic protein
MYDALDRGIVNGTISAASVLTSYNLAEVVRYAANVRFTVSSFFVAMNRDRWESLSAQDQRVLDEAANESLALRAASICDTTDTDAADAGRARGVAISDLAPDELERWKSAAQDVPRQWLREREASGIPARDVYDHLVAYARADEAGHA